MLVRARRRMLLLVTALAVMAASLTACSLTTTRTYLLHVPPCASPCPARPLVLVLHGIAGTAAQAEAYTDFDHYADLDNFVVAYPQGLATNVITGAWNAGPTSGPLQCCGAATADDLTWLASLPKAIDAHTPIDLRRVYVAGFSNGGMMAWKAVCERPDVFAAAEVVSGALLVPCAKTVVHVLHAHDPVTDCFVPYYGGYTCGGKPTPAIPADFPDSANESHLVAPGSVVKFVPITSGHDWPTLVLAPHLATSPMTLTSLSTTTDPQHAAAFGWTFLQQWKLR